MQGSAQFLFGVQNHNMRSPNLSAKIVSFRNGRWAAMSLAFPAERVTISAIILQ